MSTPMGARFSLRLRIGAAFAVSFLCFLLAGVFAQMQLQSLGETLRVLDRGYVKLAAVAARMEGSVLRLDGDMDRLRRVEDPRVQDLQTNLSLTRSLLQAQVANGRDVVAQTLPTLRRDAEVVPLETLDLQLRTIEEHILRYDEVAGRVIERVAAGDSEGAQALQTELLRARGNLRSEVEKFSARVETRIRQSATRATKQQEEAFRLSLGLGSFALGVGALMLGLALRELTPLTLLTRQVRALAGGTTGVRVAVTRQHELGVLQANFNLMAQAIEERAAQLHRAQAELRSVLDSIRLGLVVVESQRVSLCNPAATALWEVHEGEPLPQALLEHPDQSSLSLAGRRFEVNRTPFGQGFILVGEDVTEREATRTRLARSERLALVGQMLAQITHEVRNPLNALSLNAELLAEDLDALPESRRAEAHAILGTLTSEIRRLEQVTGHYLNMARRPAPSLRPEDPEQVLRGVQRLLDEELRRAGVELELRCPSGLSVDMDPNQLRQALLNVLRNSLEAGARRIEIEVSSGPEDLRVLISDDGQGLQPDQLERVFEPFRTSKAQGSGLGLAITRQILEDHGGTARAEPSAQGARIVLQWPLKAGEPEMDD